MHACNKVDKRVATMQLKDMMTRAGIEANEYAERQGLFAHDRLSCLVYFAAIIKGNSLLERTLTRFG